MLRGQQELRSHRKHLYCRDTQCLFWSHLEISVFMALGKTSSTLNSVTNRERFNSVFYLYQKTDLPGKWLSLMRWRTLCSSALTSLPVIQLHLPSASQSSPPSSALPGVDASARPIPESGLAALFSDILNSVFLPNHSLTAKAALNIHFPCLF